jgi:hypothetical protein
VALLAPIITDGAIPDSDLKKMLEGLRTSHWIFTSAAPKVNRQNATKAVCRRHQQTGLPPMPLSFYGLQRGKKNVAKVCSVRICLAAHTRSIGSLAGLEKAAFSRTLPAA